MKKLVKRSIIIIFCFGLFSVHAQVGIKKVAQSTMGFLKVGVSPKAAAMGNAYTAVCNDVESMFYNPAGLAEIPDAGLSAFLSQTQWIADINYLAGGLARNFGTLGTFGISFLSVDYGDIQGVELVSLSDPQGYRLTGNLDIGAYALGLAYARRISTQFSMGGLVQYVGQNLGDSRLDNGTVENSVDKVIFNFGIKYQTDFKRFRFAMAIRNFSTDVKYEEISVQMPMVFMVGMGIDVLQVISPDYQGDPFLISVEFLHPNNYTERVNIGSEYTLIGVLALRAGYEFNRDLAGFSAGFGIRPEIGGKLFELSYSYSDMQVFDAVNRLSFTFAL
ncbi:MAG: PorV/PorQ family protein [candidate division KSB1 bacterium]|nr:PorV/PorQ family protein [candidate division KSB1 bacterium]